MNHGSLPSLWRTPQPEHPADSMPSMRRRMKATKAADCACVQFRAHMLRDARSAGAEWATPRSTCRVELATLYLAMTRECAPLRYSSPNVVRGSCVTRSDDVLAPRELDDAVRMSFASAGILSSTNAGRGCVDRFRRHACSRRLSHEAAHLYYVRVNA